MEINIGELVKKLNELKILQTSIDWQEDLPEEYINLFEKFSTVTDELHIDRHRWYEAAVEILEYEEQLIAVKSVTNVYSESMDVRDCDHILEFFEVRETKIVKTEYKLIKNK
jgi:hypothetical protein